MSSSAYHQSPRLDESGVRSDSQEDPWLDDKTTTPYRHGPVRLNARSARPPQPRAAWPHGSVSSVRHAKTIKLQPIRAPRLVAKSPMTPDQLSHAALEAYWRGQHQAFLRARKIRRIGWSAALAAVLLGALVLGLSKRGALPSIPWQRPPTVNLADLLTRQHASSTATTEVPVPSAQPDELNDQADTATPQRTERSSVVVTPANSDAPVSPATLRIDSQPWARVFIDDVLIGNTPQLSITLQPGLHNLRLYNPELVLLRNITLDAKPGETISRVERLDP